MEVGITNLVGSGATYSVVRHPLDPTTNYMTNQAAN